VTLKWSRNWPSAIFGPLSQHNGCEQRCIFRKHATDSLDAENIPWDLTLVAASCSDCTPYPSAGLAVAAALQGTEPEDWQEIPASVGLPKLSEFMIYLHITGGPESLLAHHLASIARDAFITLGQ
jgi:hypothetical protein